MERNSPPEKLTNLIRVKIDKQTSIVEWHDRDENTGWLSEDLLGKSLRVLLPRLKGKSLNSDTTEPLAIDTELVKKSGGRLPVRVIRSATVEQNHILLIEDRSEEKFLEMALLEASEREQRRIGQDLHDHLCQHLLGAAFGAKALAGALDRDKSPHAPALHDLARLVNDAVAQVRDVSRGLHPVELDADGLMTALKNLAGRASKMVPCEFHSSGEISISDSNRALQAYRIAQEGIASALRTNAKTISISLSENSGTIVLTVKDDGPLQGELTTDPLGTGVRTLQYRARALDGTLSITFEPEQGTTLSCTFPKS